MKRLSLNERSGTTLSSLIESNGGPCGENPFVRLSKPVGASVTLDARASSVLDARAKAGGASGTAAPFVRNRSIRAESAKPGQGSASAAATAVATSKCVRSMRSPLPWLVTDHDATNTTPCVRPRISNPEKIAYKTGDVGDLRRTDVTPARESGRRSSRRRGGSDRSRAARRDPKLPRPRVRPLFRRAETC